MRAHLFLGVTLAQILGHAETVPFRSNLFEITAKRSSTDSRSEILAQEFPNCVSQSASRFRFIK